jgi:hypothetical protein
MGAGIIDTKSIQTLFVWQWPSEDKKKHVRGAGLCHNMGALFRHTTGCGHQIKLRDFCFSYVAALYIYPLRFDNESKEETVPWSYWAWGRVHYSSLELYSTSVYLARPALVLQVKFSRRVSFEFAVDIIHKFPER